MERGASEFSRSGLNTPYTATFNDASVDSPAEHQSPASYPAQEVRPVNYSASATPTSEYSVHPSSARSSSFPEHIQRQYYPSSSHSGSSGDPSIAASSPTYPPHGGPYSAYPPQQEMSHAYPQHPGGPMYAQQPRPDWAGYGQHPQHGMPAPYPSSGVSNPNSAAPSGPRPGQHPLSQVYSFVPIPGAQQHKRPRRRYEEIERMYKCGWNGCEKAYGTLNHLNAHVTMQSHGQKRTPEEFKEIRKEWKARKKEEDAQRKAEDDRARAAQVQSNPADGQNPNDSNQPPPGYQQPGRAQVQLPPIGYQPGAQVPGQYQAPSGGVQQLQEYSNSHMYSGYPASPYGAPSQMYSQHNGAPAPKYEQH
ncbi:hypothetical protein O988_09385 [Pseudogymnoascus sp. VKM F-3808]|nr:hypothetical protein O988_09385 [Pseudogymnoascus sp. VKM F-3808]